MKKNRNSLIENDKKRKKESDCSWNPLVNKNVYYITKLNIEQHKFIYRINSLHIWMSHKSMSRLRIIW